MDLFRGGIGATGNVDRHNANCIPPAIRRKFQDAPNRVRVIDRRPPGRKAANGRGRAAVAMLPRVRGEQFQGIA